MSDFYYLKNGSQLLSHGEADLRRAALDVLDRGILGGDPGRGTRKAVSLHGDRLRAGDLEIDLGTVNRIFVLGVGKGSYPIAEALEEILGSRINKGFLAVKKGETRRLKHIEVLEAGHPLPDENSLEAGRRLLALAREAGEGDLVFLAITGGCSALSICPPEGVSLADYQQVTDQLLGSGAIIRDINAVRKHLCQLKGGRFVAQVQPAMGITLTLDTQPKGMLWPDMSLPDQSTFLDALEVLHTTGVWERAPQSVKSFLNDGLHHPEWETLKTLDGLKAHLVSVGDQIRACENAARRAAELGYEPHILSTSIQGEASQVARVMAGLTREIILRDRPFKTPCALISGGEMTVSLGDKPGRGGPNQEFALHFATEIEPLQGFVCAAVDSDGTDGPTDIAGGISDGRTMARAAELKVDLAAYLKEHASSEALEKLDDPIITGHTGTNVLNIRVVLVDPRQR